MVAKPHAGDGGQTVPFKSNSYADVDDEETRHTAVKYAVANGEPQLSLGGP